MKPDVRIGKAWVVDLLPVLVCCVCAGADLPRPEPITRLKRLYPATTLARDGRTCAVIAVPDRPELRACAQRLAAAITRLTGVRPATVSDADLVDEDWQVDADRAACETIVAVGNINTNRVLRVLWGQGYVVADSIYPGPGGHVVRTVHDPFAKGVNVLALCGSDDDGVARAVDVFLRHVTDGSAPPGHAVLESPVVDVAFTPVEQRFFPAPPSSADSKRQPQYTGLDWFRKRWQEAGFMDAEGNVIRHANAGVKGTVVTGLIARMGQTFFRTGNRDLLPLMKTLLDRNRHLLANPDRVNEMGGRSADHVLQWDLLEEWPVWTDRERLDITNALLADSALGHEPRAFHQQVLDGAVQALDENHGTFSAWRSFCAWQYFGRYYPSAASDYWLRCGRAVFDAQASTFQILEDASGYLCYSPATTCRYAFASGNLRYLKRGIARHHARFVAQACINNLGLTTGFGDDSGVVQPAFFELVAPVAWYHRDPELSWVMRNMLPQACGLRIFQSNIPVDMEIVPRRPDSWTGVTRIPIYDAPLVKGQAVEEPVFAGKDEVAPELFNKIVFREGWDPEDQYLLLDGAGVWGGPPGPHGHKHDDINTIVNFTDNGRMWLVDHTYQKRAYSDHSGVLFLLDGAGAYRKRTLARLEALCDTPLWGISRTAFLRGSRTIFWRKGRWFTVMDQHTADSEGTWFARCSWRALGIPRASEPGTLRLEQDGQFFDIVSDGQSSCSLDTHAFASRDWLRFYTHAEPVVRILRQDKVRALGVGEQVSFVNVLRPYASEVEARDVVLDAAEGHAAWITDRGQSVLLAVDSVPGTELRAAAAVIAPDAILLVGADTLPGGIGRSSAPVSWSFDLRQRSLAVTAPAACDVLLSPPGGEGAVGEAVWSEHVREGTTHIPLREWSGLGVLTAVVETALSRRPPTAADFAISGVLQGCPEARPAATFDVDMPVSVAVQADVDPGEQEEWIFGGPDGLSCRKLPAGGVLWEARGFPVRCLATGDLDGDGQPEVVCGSADHRVRVFAGNGTLLWQAVCKASEGSIDGPPAVDWLEVHDLDGDGKAEVIAGANWVHVFEADGALRWERYMAERRGRICGDMVAGAVSDVDGDGRPDVVAAFNTSYPELQIFQASGENMVPRPGGRRVNIGVPTGVSVLPFPGSSRPYIACATEGDLCLFAITEPVGAVLAGRIPGSCIDAVFAAASDGSLTAVVANPFYGLQAHRLREVAPGKLSVERLWYRTFPASVSGLSTIPSPTGGTRLAVGLGNGMVILLDLAGGSVLSQARIGQHAVAVLASAGTTLNAIDVEGHGVELRWP